MDFALTETRSFEDARKETRDARLALGFNERDSWKTALAYFDQHTLTIQNHPVMEDWEDSYMCELAHIATRRGGTVLEIGFGMGISARYIQKESLEQHFVIEANADVYERLTHFAKEARIPVAAFFGFWEDVTTKIPDGSISGILFDTYPLSEKDIHCNHFPFFKEAYRLLRPGGVLTYYSDEIDDFSFLHLKMLRDAGFVRIDKKICEVSPPADCAYWKSKTILAPIVTK